ncbi:MAG: hypothetical protein AB7F43_07880 [Bacteriovoracia bacterium]
MFRKIFLTTILLTSNLAFAYECPEGFYESAGTLNVLELVRAGNAYLDFQEDVVIPAGESRAKVEWVSVVDERGATQAKRIVRAGTLRKISYYDWGHNGSDMNYYLYATGLRISFEGSKYYQSYEDLLDHSGEKIRLCLAEITPENL